MRKAASSTLFLSLLSCASMAITHIAFACQRIGPVSPDEICRKADAIVRATAVEYDKAPKGGLRSLDVPGEVTIRFAVDEVIKGRDLPRELVINGHLTDFDDFNDRPVPYDFVRPGGRRGNCTAYEYKRGAEFLLFLKNSEGKLSLYWDPLSPTNEQLRSKNDPWLLWVREHLKELEKGGEKDKSSRLRLEPIMIALKWCLTRRVAA